MSLPLTPQQRYRKNHPERSRAQTKKWADANQDHLAETQRARRDARTEDDWERVRERDRKRYETDNRRASRQAAREIERSKDPDAYDRKQADRMMRSRVKRSLEDYETVLTKQGGHCATCANTEAENGKRLSWDHDHSCCAGRKSCGQCVRGLLCISCNRLLGLIEGPHLLQKLEALTNYQVHWRAP